LLRSLCVCFFIATYTDVFLVSHAGADCATSSTMLLLPWGQRSLARPMGTGEVLGL
jgi:hypothetical protein